LLSKYSSSLRSFKEESFRELKRIPEEMNSNSLAQLAAHPHGFQTGTKDRPGRLILRSVLEHEVAQFTHILRENHNYPGAQAGLDNFSEDIIHYNLFKKYKKTERRMFELFIILKPGLEDSLKLPFKRARHIVNGGHVIGVITLVLHQHPQNASDCGAYTGIIVHHEARRHHFGKEAWIAALDYILLGQPTTLRNGNLAGLGLPKVHIETAKENEAFIKLMEELHLKTLQRGSTPDHGQDYRMRFQV
jgi:RimJ/RimL family protein N-acetyltransferase